MLNRLSDPVAVQGAGSKKSVDLADLPLQPELRQVFMCF